MKKAKEIRRNAAGVPVPTQEQIEAAHAYATDLLRDGASSREVSPLHLACALFNSHCTVRMLQSELAKIATTIGGAMASGLLPAEDVFGAVADNNEPARFDPRTN